MLPLALYADECFADHAPADGRPHVEQPARNVAVLQAVEGLPRQTLSAPAADETLHLVHGRAYVEHVADVCQHGGGPLDGGDTYANGQTDHLARLAVACGIAAAEDVLHGRARRGFVAARPPGHHALPDAAMGFCVYSTAAIVAAHLRRHGNVARVATIDFDVHHGNGTQAAFYRDPDVLTVSLHEDPATLWPGTGAADERGEAAGVGTCLNVPLAAGTGDAAYLAAFDEAMEQLASFGPSFLVVSAGFDAHADDPLAHLALSDTAFVAIGERLARAADERCGGRLVGVLEGGYDLRALRVGLRGFLDALL